MNPIDLIEAKKKHINRLANRQGAAGEIKIVSDKENWIARPKGMELKILLDSLRKTGIDIKGSSFDAISLPYDHNVNFKNTESVEIALQEMTFIEIKTSNQKRAMPNFVGFFFALTEAEIDAADKLGDRHKVALYNNLTKELLITNVSEIVNRAKSQTWQLSVQL
jgi:hypothetical protein